VKRIFNPKRLRQALIYRNMTASELAERTDEVRSTVSMYQNGKVDSVDIEKVKKFSKELKFPMNFFFEVDEIFAKSPVYFRSQLTAKKNYRDAQKVKLEFLINVYRFLNKYIEFPKLNIPNCSGLSPEDAADLLRQKWGLGDGPIKNLIRVAENNGIIVACCSTQTNAIDAFSKRFTIESSEEAFIIGYSANKQTAARIHFDIAHELGHICLHDWEDIDEIDKDEFKEKESEANRFAAAFLLPEEPFSIDARITPLSIPAYTKLKAKWKTSIQAMIMRTRNLNIIKHEVYTDFIINMQKRGLRKSEPLDDKLITAEPSMLSTAVMLLLENNVFDATEFMDRLSTDANLSIYPEEIEKLLELPDGILQKSKILKFKNLSIKE
jgi:Zn-dependent peptidase ImmA (M78 family)